MVGIDLGDKRVGIAIAVEDVAFPHGIVKRIQLVKFLKKLVIEKSIKTIVVGLPYDLYGTDTRQLDKTKRFIEKLEEIFPEQQIVGFDERFTSIEADSCLEKFGNKEKNTYKDDISAALILEGYMRSLKH